MSSPNHPTSDIEDAFSSNFPDYILVSPDYVPASPRKTYSSSSNNSFGLVPIASPTLSLFYDDRIYEEFFLPEVSAALEAQTPNSDINVNKPDQETAPVVAKKV
ncbi:hypothetical protein Tco_1401070 [Tanacetum coccineum]